MVFTNVTNPRSAVIRKDEYKTTHARKGASIGSKVTIVSGNELVVFCLLCAGAIIIKPLRAFALMVGNPAKHTGASGIAPGSMFVFQRL
jgi:UDP-2-acetamido-3-amino-2,3-dideoxy-glucuronate N-acetyltransferase